jgi:hypothetical protein
VSMLNSTVPTSCKPLLHQSIRCGSKVTIRNLRERLRPLVRVDRLQPLQRRRRGEEDRPDEEHHAVDARADELHEAWERPDQEAGRPEGEEHPDPPRHPVRNPPDARVAGSRQPRRVLAMGSRRPGSRPAVGSLPGDVSRERPDRTAGQHLPPRRRARVRPHAQLGSAQRAPLRRRPRRERVQLVLSFLDHPEARLRHLVPGSREVAERL